jgi:hypothetical protein
VTANHVEVIAYFTAASLANGTTNQAYIFVAITIKKPLFGDEFQEKFTIDITPVARLKRETIGDRVNLFRTQRERPSSSSKQSIHEAVAGPANISRDPIALTAPNTQPGIEVLPRPRPRSAGY